MLKSLALLLFLLLPLNATAGTLTALDPGDLAGAWLIRDKGAETLRTYLFVLSGEADNDGPEGLAHFVEHLAWESVKEQDGVARAGHSNAYTTHQQTGYWLSGEPGDAESMLQDLMRALQPLRSSEEFVVGEREIVQREYDFRKRENWRAAAREGIKRRLHAQDPRQKVVGGVLQSIDNYSLVNAKALHRNTHSPQNAVLVIRGNVSKRAANKHIKKLRGRSTSKHKALPVGGHKRYQMAAAARDVQTKSYVEAKRSELIYKKVIALEKPLPIPQLLAESRLLLSLLSSRLSGGLAVPLRYDNFFTEFFSLDIEVLDNQHLMLTFEASPDIGVMPATLLAVLERELSRSAKAGVVPEVLAEIKRRRHERRKSANKYAVQLEIIRLSLAFKEQPVTAKQQARIEKKVNASALSKRLRALAGNGRVVAEIVVSSGS